MNTNTHRDDEFELDAFGRKRRKRKGADTTVSVPTTLMPNISEATTRLYELIKQRNLRVYPNHEIRLAISRAVAVEGSRGWRSQG
jgi:hypothetical protein